MPAHDGLVLVANGDALEREAGASGRSWPPALGQSDRDLRGDPGRAARTLAGAGRGLDARVAGESTRRLAPLRSAPRGRPYGYQDSAEWSRLVNWMGDHRLLRTSTDPRAAFTNDYLPGRGL